jgi:hypothetical protein
MSRIKFLILIALVSLLAATVGLAQAQTADDAVGTAVISDDAAQSDAITYTLADIAAPAAGTVLVGWLISDDGSIKLNTGAMTVEADGSVSHTFGSASAGYTGEDLIAAYNTVVITAEPTANAAGADPAGPPVYNHTVPLGAMTHIRHLVVGSPGGGENGIITNLQTQLDAAIAQANLAKNAATLDDALTQTQGVIDLLEDADGAITQAATARSHAALAAAAATNDEVIEAQVALVDVTAQNAENWATEAKDIAATKIIGSTNLAIAKIFIGPGAGTVISALEAARNGYDSDGDGTIESIAGEGGAEQAYVEAQKIATYTLTPGAPAPVATPTPEPGATATPDPDATATPVPGEEEEGGLPGLPSVGDSSVPLMAQVALIVSLLTLGTGGILFIRTRRSRTSA